MGPLTEWRPFAPLSPMAELPTWDDMLTSLFVDLPGPPTSWQPPVMEIPGVMSAETITVKTVKDPIKTATVGAAAAPAKR